MPPNELFIIYVRTLQFMKLRLRGLDESEGVFISQSDIDTRFFPFPEYDRRIELQNVFGIETGDLLYLEDELKSVKDNYHLLKGRKILGKLLFSNPNKFIKDTHFIQPNYSKYYSQIYSKDKSRCLNYCSPCGWGGAANGKGGWF